MKTNRYIVFAGMGFELVGIIVSGAWFGSQLDETYQTKGLITLALTIGGLAGWIYHLVVLAKRIDRAQEQDDNSQQEQ